ncbi:MAG: hypothetical protein BWY54_00440 [Candidatus Dependentiae bacterium ADurb.Bin331]|nr:MAG: hypothetical protein BWY54_00440 [Candidatus Dependentiae bacterium ADurb.Bin331]
MNFKTTLIALLVTCGTATGILNAGSIYWPGEFRKLEQTIFGNDCSSDIDTIRTVRINYKTFTVKAKQRVTKVKVDYGIYYYHAKRTITILEKNMKYRSVATSKPFSKCKPMTEAKASLTLAGGVCTLVGAAMLLFADTM